MPRRRRRRRRRRVRARGRRACFVSNGLPNGCGFTAADVSDEYELGDYTVSEADGVDVVEVDEWEEY
jgi:hypothetical protein